LLQQRDITLTWVKQESVIELLGSYAVLVNRLKQSGFVAPPQTVKKQNNNKRVLQRGTEGPMMIDINPKSYDYFESVVVSNGACARQIKIHFKRSKPEFRNHKDFREEWIFDHYPDARTAGENAFEDEIQAGRLKTEKERTAYWSLLQRHDDELQSSRSVRANAIAARFPQLTAVGISDDDDENELLLNKRVKIHHEIRDESNNNVPEASYKCICSLCENHNL
jgi:hypothetical protein